MCSSLYLAGCRVGLPLGIPFETSRGRGRCYSTAACNPKSHEDCGASGKPHLQRAFDDERRERPLRAPSNLHLLGRQVGHQGTWLKAVRAAMWTGGSSEDGLQ